MTTLTRTSTWQIARSRARKRSILFSRPLAHQCSSRARQSPPPKHYNHRTRARRARLPRMRQPALLPPLHPLSCSRAARSPAGPGYRSCLRGRLRPRRCLLLPSIHRINRGLLAHQRAFQTRPKPSRRLATGTLMTSIMGQTVSYRTPQARSERLCARAA